MLNASDNLTSVGGLDEYKSNDDLALEVLFEGYPRSLVVFGSVCCLVMMIIGIPGNLITVIALARYKKIRNATAIFIIHLHIIDFIFCVTILPIVAVTLFNGHWAGGKTLCRLYAMMKYMLSGNSLFSIVAIAINRYVMCCHPLLYPRLYKGKYIYLMITGIWLLNFVSLLPTYHEILGRFSLDRNLGFCTMIADKYDRSPKLPLLIGAFVIPCIIMCICYIRIMWVVRNTTRKCRQTEIKVDSSTTRESISDEDGKQITQNEDRPSEGTGLQKRLKRTTIDGSVPNRKDKRLQTMIVIIMVTFCVCRLPYLLTNIVYKGTVLKPVACLIGFTLIHAASCLNPILYVLMSSEYRKAYKNLFKTVKNKLVGV